MTGDELQLLSTLDSLVFQPDALATIEQLANELTQQLQSKPTAAFARAELAISLFGAALPAEAKSSNVYVIRPGVSSGIERHPNSHQHSMSLRGEGTFALGLAGERCEHRLQGKASGAIARRWVSIPPQTWHEAIAGSGLWTVVTFHTAPDREIINERLSPPGA